MQTQIKKTSEAVIKEDVQRRIIYNSFILSKTNDLESLWITGLIWTASAIWLLFWIIH